MLHLLRVMPLIVALVFSSIASAAGNEITYEEMLARNSTNISGLTLRMTKKQVVNLMKPYTCRVHDGPLSNPYRSDVFQRGPNSYEVLYYLTRGHPPFTPIADWQATPVVLKNGEVVGWGSPALQGLK